MHFAMVIKVIIMMRVITKIMNSGSYRWVLPIVAKLTILPSASVILLLVEDASHGFEN